MRSSSGGQFSGGIVSFYQGALPFLPAFVALCSFGLAFFRAWAFVAFLGWVAFVPVASAGGCFGFSVWLCCFWVVLSGVLGNQCAASVRVCQAWRFSAVFSSVHFSRYLRFASLVKFGHRWVWCLSHIGANRSVWVGGGWTLAAIILGLTSRSKGRAARWRF